MLTFFHGFPCGGHGTRSYVTISFNPHDSSMSMTHLFSQAQIQRIRSLESKSPALAHSLWTRMSITKTTILFGHPASHPRPLPSSPLLYLLFIFLDLSIHAFICMSILTGTTQLLYHLLEKVELCYTHDNATKSNTYLP